jgi:YD repeat-containing protein
VNSERLQPGNDIGHDGDLADGSMDNDLIGRDAFGFALGYYGDDDYKGINSTWDDDLAANVALRPFAPIGTTGTLTTEHEPLYNGNIATTTYTLEPFGNGVAGWDMGNTEGQVLAQVYTYDQLNRLKKARGVIGLTSTNTWDGVVDNGLNEDNRYRSQYEYDANGNIISANRYDIDGNHYDQFAYKYQKRDGRTMRNRLYELYDDADAADNYVNEIGGAEDINYNQTITNPLDPAYFDEEDPALNGLHNYHYDALGNLIHDEREQIQAIEWTVAGKVKSVSRTTGSTRKPLSFAYGASGQRILKNVSDPDLDVTGSREHYIRDAQGNIMATYRYTNPGSASLQLNDRPLYGSARLGTLGEEMELHSLLNWDPADPVIVDPVDLNYELTDHLGNVCTVVTGRLMDGNGGGTLKQAELVSAQGYEPFGSLLPGRKYDAQRARPVILLPAVLTTGQSVTMTIGGGAPINLVSYTPGWTLAQYLSAICTALGSNGITAVSYPAQNQVRIDNWPSNADLTTGLPIAEMRWDTYRFTFQGQEHDDEINGGGGTSYAFEYRIHDSRIGRFLRIDPLAAKYVWNSPYAFSENRVVDAFELEGLESVIHTFIRNDGGTTLELIAHTTLDNPGKLGNGHLYIYNDLNTGTTESHYYEDIYTDNYMGYTWVGPRNPALPCGAPDYGRAPQDYLDYAAYRHDMAYDNAGAAGPEDAKFNLDVIEADRQLVRMAHNTWRMENDPITGKRMAVSTKWKANGVIEVFQRYVDVKQSVINYIRHTLYTQPESNVQDILTKYNTEQNSNYTTTMTEDDFK